MAKVVSACVLVFTYAVAKILSSESAIAACEDKQKNERTLTELGLEMNFKLPLDACPIASARVRGSDILAKEGGGFFAGRGTSSCHFALDLEFVGEGVKTGLGEPVLATAAGTIALASTDWGTAGQTVIIDHGNNLYTLYAHLRDISAKVKSPVNVGDRIGAIGYSGNASKLKDNTLPPHLHFVVFRTKEPLANWKPLSVVKESEKVNDELPFMDGFGFIDASGRLRALGCFSKK